MANSNPVCSCHAHVAEPGSSKAADHSHDRGGVETSAVVSVFLSAALLLCGGLLPLGAGAKFYLRVAAYLAAGWQVLWQALRHMLQGKFFDETFLMAVASLGALCIGEVTEGVVVMLFYDVGELFQGIAVGRSRRSIQSLMDIRPDRANLVTENGIRECAAEDVVPGDTILVKAGERIPLDGVVLEGASSLDTAALTGESMPRDVRISDRVLGGCVNLTGVLTVRVTTTFGTSTPAKMLALVENAEENKAPAQQFITKFARYYTPIVVLIAALIALIPPLFFGGVWSDFIHRALVFLVISCPCALVISVPMGFFAGIGCASKNGILIKGSNYLSALCRVDTVVFDKTGTLTEGKFTLTGVTEGALSKAQLLDYAAHAEAYSNHPIAQSVRRAYGVSLTPSRTGSVTEIPGGGVKAVIDGREVLVGNRRLLTQASIVLPTHETDGTSVYVAVDGVFGGILDIGDAPKAEAAPALSGLKKLGVRRTVMLTGDRQSAGDRVGRAVGVDLVYGDLLPADKVAKLENLLGDKDCKGNLLFIGDGINDAPGLARADVGIAMGGLGADAAIEAADVVIMDDNLKRLPQAIKIARHTRKIVTENIAFALLVKCVVLLLGAAGMANMWMAVFADVGVSLLAVLNSMRALHTRSIHEA